MSKLSDNDNGVSQAVVIAIIIVVIIVAGALVWGLTKKTTNNKNVSTTNKTSTNVTNVSSSCLQTYHDSVLCAFSQHVNILAYSYIAVGTATNSTGSTSNFTIENDGKGDREVTYTTGDKQLSSITIAGSQYIQEGVGTTWLEYTGSGVSATAVPDPTSGFNLNFSTSNSSQFSYSKVGSSACGDLTCNEYKVTLTAQPSIMQYVYFDTSNHLLRKWVYNDPLTSVSVTTTFDYQSVNITKPTPVQVISS